MRGTGRRKAAAEIVRTPGEGSVGDFPGGVGTAGGCGRGRCELVALGLGGISGGVRNGVLFALDNGVDGSGSARLGGGSARGAGEEGTEGADGTGRTLVDEGCSVELRGVVGDPGARPRVRVSGGEG